MCNIFWRWCPTDKSTCRILALQNFSLQPKMISVFIQQRYNSFQCNTKALSELHTLLSSMTSTFLMLHEEQVSWFDCWMPYDTTWTTSVTQETASSASVSFTFSNSPLESIVGTIERAWIEYQKTYAKYIKSWNRNN